MLILSAGLNRSGSTWLYNAVRLLIKGSNCFPGIVCAGWVDDINVQDNNKHYVIKLHEFNEELVSKADFIFYSYRDMRDVLASLKRKFRTEPSLHLADSLFKKDKLWRDVAHFSMKYEDMTKDNLFILRQLSKSLGINDVDLDKVNDKLQSLSFSSEGDKGLYNKSNLYHQNHITNGMWGSWQGELDNSLVTEIVLAYNDWFVENKYL